MKDINDLLKLATDLGFDAATGKPNMPEILEPREERVHRARGDYRLTPEFIAEFGEPCDCEQSPNGPGGQCLELPCRRRENHFPDAGKMVGAPTDKQSLTVAGISEDEFYRRSRIPLAYRGCRISTWEPQGDPRIADVRRYLEKWPPEKPFMLLTGGQGLGKTHLAIGVAREAWERHGRLSQFWSVRELLAYVKSTFDRDTATTTEAEIGRMLDYAPLLILDDFGKEQDTPWARSFLFGLIDRRYANGWATVITTNVDPADDPMWDRILDRSKTVIVPFTGKSHRQLAS